MFICICMYAGVDACMSACGSASSASPLFLLPLSSAAPGAWLRRSGWFLFVFSFSFLRGAPGGGAAATGWGSRLRLMSAGVGGEEGVGGEAPPGGFGGMMPAFCITCVCVRVGGWVCGCVGVCVVVE